MLIYPLSKFGPSDKFPSMSFRLTYLVLFSWINFFTWSRHCKKLKVILGNLSDGPQILTVGRLAYKQQKWVCEFFLSKYFFNESDFCTNHEATRPPLLNKLASLPMCGFIAQLVAVSRRSRVRIPLRPWFFSGFFFPVA